MVVVTKKDKVLFLPKETKAAQQERRDTTTPTDKDTEGHYGRRSKDRMERDTDRSCSSSLQLTLVFPYQMRTYT
jgi:hypothetical protein